MLASIYLFLLALQVAVQCVSGSTIVTYTDSNCSYPSLQLSGPDNGICQQTLSGAGSFKITTLDAGCVVTVYGVDAPYCDVNDNWAIYIDHCYANSSINQYSIDGCSTISDASSSSPFPSQSSASAASKPSSVSSTGVKAGIGAGVAVAAIALIVIPIWILRRRRRQSAANIPRPNETEMSLPDKSLAAELHSHSIHGAFVPALSREGLQGSTVDLKPNERKHHPPHELGGRALVELE